MRALSAPLAFALILAACGNDANPNAKPKVAVSIFPLYDVARRVAGDRLDVVLVLPPGRSEHGYEPTPQQMTQVARARLAVVVGLEMDPWAERIVRGAAGDDVSILRLGPTLDPRRLSEPEVGIDVVAHAHEHGGDDEHGDHDALHDEHGAHGAHDEHAAHDDDDHQAHAGDAHTDRATGSPEHGRGVHDRGGDSHAEHGGDGHGHAGHHGRYDPHFWLDPVRMGRAVDRMVEAFSALDPAGAATFRANGARVQAALTELHARIEDRAQRWQRRTIVTFHGSFGYFAQRYGLRIAAVIEPFPGREPTPRYMQDVLTAIEASGAAALFSEPQLDPRPARVIAERAHVALHTVDPVGGTSGVDSYERLLEHDAAVFDRALGSAP